MNKYEALKQYKELLESEIITQEEFDVKKKELLALPDDIEVNNDKSFSKTKKNTEGDINKTAFEKSIEIQKSFSELSKANAKRKADKKAEKKARKEEKKKNKEPFFKRKKVRIVLAIIVGIIALSYIVAFIENLALTDISKDMSETQSSVVHEMEYKVPKSWNKDDNASNEVLERYIKTDENNETIAFLEVGYVGENDLTGKAGVDTSYPFPEDAYDVLPDCKGDHQLIDADNAEFEVTVYYVEDTVKGIDNLLSEIAGTMDSENYNNPRESVDLSAKYSGNTKAGTIIDNDSGEITVYEIFDTGVNKGKRAVEWMLDKSVKLKAGKTSTLILHTDIDDVKLKVECSTLSKAQYKAKCKFMNYKNQLRKESFDKHIKIYGEVLQDCGAGYFRIGSSGYFNTDDVYMVQTESNIVEGDVVTCYGVTAGIYEYETVMGANQKVPMMIAKYVER